MKTIDSIRLSDVLQLVPKPKYVLGTTYTLSLAFFESVVFPYIDTSQLRTLVIICDKLGYQRALTEAAALQGAAQDYLVVPAPIAGAFHPKVWLVVGEKQAMLLCGSGNLTQAGFMTNAEYFDAVHITTEPPPPSELLASMKSFVKGLSTMWPVTESQHLLCVERLIQIADALEEFPTTPETAQDAPKFIHSFTGPLLDQLPPAASAKAVYVAAPFFGNSLKGLNALAARYKTKSLYVFPAIHSGETTDIPLKQLAKEHKHAKSAPLSTPGKKGALAHLKLYAAITDSKKSWLCCTSANCTTAAWQGPNVEAGLIRFMPPSACQEYFAPSKEHLPDGRLQYKGEASDSALIHCWASDTGGGIDVAVHSASHDQLPLSNVELTVRAGSRLTTAQRSTLFQDSAFAHLPWNVFDSWERPSKRAITFELVATNAKGKSVRAHCLVENSLLLRADPIHRSAWRGALALLDTEGVPELADIAAIFTLARDLFDGNLIRSTLEAGATSEEEQKHENSSEPPAVAVWPPQPDLRELQKSVGRQAVGQIQWFQRILQTFLRKDEAQEAPAHHSSNHNHADTNIKPEEQETDSHRLAEEARAQSLASKMWHHANRDYSNLRNRLQELCPSARQAPNLWLAAIFSFLTTLAVLRAAKRMAPDLDYEASIAYLSEGFIRIMLDERKQRPDFCCPRSHRYYPRETFPDIANDLRHTFHVRLHPDLSLVILALLADWKLRAAKTGYTFSMMWPRYVKQVCESEFTTDADSRESCRRLWRRYVADDENAFTDSDFTETFDQLCSMRGQHT